MSVNIGPKIGVDGEAEYRAQINNIIQQAKNLTSQMKLVEAGFTESTTAQEKAAATADILSQQIQVQRQRISALENMLSRSADALGENDTKTLRWQQAVTDANTELVRLESELRDAQSQLDKTGESVEDLTQETKKGGEAFATFSDILGASFLADMAEDILQDAVQALKDFAVESLDTASDVKASSSKFKQSFGDMEAAAKRSLEKISDDTNIATTRMQDSFSDINSFSKTIGFESEAALDIANRAMLAAADSAAYYDTTIEEATETLQSFLKGNYENDAALGIAATETTRNAKANELYATSFDKLSEAQKVDVLLAMVEAGNAASGALGQAAREADSWTNVTGEAAEAIRLLQAEVGKPAIKLLTPIIQEATEAIYKMIEATAADELTEQIDEIIDSWEKAEKQFAETSDEIESSAIIAERYADRLSRLEAEGLDTAEAQREYANTVAVLNDLMPELNLQINEQTGLVNLNRDAILAEIDALKQKAIYTAFEEKYAAAIKTQADAALAAADAERALIEVQTSRTVIEGKLESSTGMAIDELVRMYTSLMSTNFLLQDNAELTLSAADGANTLGAATRALTAEEVAMLQEVVSLRSEETRLNAKLDEANDIYDDMEGELEDLGDTLDHVTKKTEEAADAQSGMQQTGAEVIATIEALQLEYEEAQQAARASIDSQIGYFDELSTESSKSAAEIVANWGKQQQAFQNYSANLEKAVDMGLDEVLVQQLADGSEESMAILNEFVNNTDLSVDEINKAFGDLSEARDTAATAMADVTSAVDEELDTMIANARASGYNVGAGLAAGINSSEVLVERAMNSLAVITKTSYNRTMEIKSPSRVMMESGANTVDGLVVSVEDNTAKYERAMEDLAVSGQNAFSRLGNLDSTMYINPGKAASGGGTTSISHSYGGISIAIYQQPGEDADALVRRLMEEMQIKLDIEEAGICA